MQFRALKDLGANKKELMAASTSKYPSFDHPTCVVNTTFSPIGGHGWDEAKKVSQNTVRKS
jgi:hypothetical protein